MNEYGLLIEVRNEHGTQRIAVSVCVREPEHDYPTGCNSNGESQFDENVPRHLRRLVLDGLGLHGFVDDTDGQFLVDEVKYRNVHSAGILRLEWMIKTLKRVRVCMAKDNANEPGDRFTALAAALKLNFAVEQLTQNPANPRWNWMSVADGRNRYRELIEQARATVIQRKQIKAVS